MLIYIYTYIFIYIYIYIHLQTRGSGTVCFGPNLLFASHVINMGYEMRPIARRSENNRQTSNPQRMSGQNYRAPFRPGRDYSKVKCFSCGQMGHTQARCPKPDQSLPFRPDGWNSQPDGPRHRPVGPQQGNKYNTCLLASILYGDWQGFLSIGSGLFIMSEIIKYIYTMGMQI